MTFCAIEKYDDGKKHVCHANPCGNVANQMCKCGLVFYCSIECQRMDWRVHKRLCTMSSDNSKLIRSWGRCQFNRSMVNEFCHIKKKNNITHTLFDVRNVLLKLNHKKCDNVMINGNTVSYTVSPQSHHKSCMFKIRTYLGVTINIKLPASSKEWMLARQRRCVYYCAYTHRKGTASVYVSVFIPYQNTLDIFVIGGDKYNAMLQEDSRILFNPMLGRENSLLGIPPPASEYLKKRRRSKKYDNIGLDFEELFNEWTEIDDVPGVE